MPPIPPTNRQHDAEESAAITLPENSTLSGVALAAFRGERLVLREVDFTLAPGGALLLLGRNGAGKSTLLRLLAGLVRPAAGRLLWGGEDALADRGVHAGRLAYLGHQDAIKPGLSVAENLRFDAAIGAGSINDALGALGLAALAGLPARLLSAGQKRRLALARLLLCSAPLWLLDEPTLGLDDASVEALGGLLAAHRARGGMLVAATHLPLPLPDATRLALS
jgi:heme exporter protein A